MFDLKGNYLKSFKSAREAALHIAVMVFSGVTGKNLSTLLKRKLKLHNILYLGNF